MIGQQSPKQTLISADFSDGEWPFGALFYQIEDVAA
jgi:hypothetical protein